MSKRSLPGSRQRLTKRLTKRPTWCKRWCSIKRLRTILPFALGVLCASALTFGAIRIEARADSNAKSQVTFDVHDLGTQTHPLSREALQGRTSELVCALSTFFSIDPDEIFRSRAHLEGRGLVTCRNAQGFTTEIPVRAELDALLPDHYDRESEFSFSANSSAFVIPREINELQDSFIIGPPIAASDSTPDSPALLLRGLRHDLNIGLRLNSQKSRLNGIRVTTLEIKFDEEAPDLY